MYRYRRSFRDGLRRGGGNREPTILGCAIKTRIAQLMERPQVKAQVAIFSLFFRRCVYALVCLYLYGDALESRYVFVILVQVNLLASTYT